MSVYLRAALALTCSLLAVQSATAAPVTTKTLPEWMLGEWVVTHVYQARGMDRTYFDPYQYYPGKHMTITPRQLLLTDFGCEVESVTHSTGRFKAVFSEGIGGLTPGMFDGLPKFPEKITYEKVKCSHRLAVVKDDDSSDGKETHMVFEKTISDQWNVIIRSYTEIDLPYYGNNYLQLRKVTPATS
ncbi:hypothetical protein [Acetobacter thailandicus]|uniref:hypothetical protein n=1 Tax=Acetobacter thailandicus TaxID=1502842 RepID=UPI001BA5640D|nr:hypothetical protein [Acetobacter thailandicus]MBS1003674.1 hypothetical protein [Acetobacter thailandicus]